MDRPKNPTPSFPLLDEAGDAAPPPPYSPTDTLSNLSPSPSPTPNPNPRLASLSPTTATPSSNRLLSPGISSPKSPHNGEAWRLPPNLLVTPPSPASVESFMVLDNVAWARESSRGRRERNRTVVRWMCRVALGVVIVAVLLAAAWGAILYGLFGPSGSE